MDGISRSSGWDEFSQDIMQIQKFSRGFIFVKRKSSRNGEITLSTTDIGKLYIESWLRCMQGALRVVLYTKKLHFVSWIWRMEN